MAAYAALVSLKSTVDYYLKYYDICLTPTSLQMLHLLHNELKSLEQFLNTSDSSSRDQMNPRLHRIALSLQEFDDILQIYASELRGEAQSGDDCDPSLGLESVKEAFDATTASLKELQRSFPLTRRTKSKLVGLIDQYDRVKQSIFLFPFVISVVGMAGNGKTTLAKEFFIDLDVVEEFEVRVWVDVGRSYSKEAVLRDILAQIDPAAHQRPDSGENEDEDDDVNEEEEDAQEEDENVNVDECVNEDEGEDEKEEEEEDDEDEDEDVDVDVDEEDEDVDVDEEEDEDVDVNVYEVEEDDENKLIYRLKRSLHSKRYLIVFDDVCDPDFWYNMEFSLPNKNAGSKVLITTRSREVADNAGAVFDMRLLNEDESWDLLRDKVFGEELCPPQLVKAGKKIAEHCDGLPLTIVSVSKLLSKAGKASEFWNEVAARKKHPLFLAAYDAILDVLYPSYWDLSSQLRICFLYMGVFRQDYKIPRSKIINLWISEDELLDPIADQYAQQFLFGFISVEEFTMLRNTPEQILDLESYAAEYLEDLASKTLVMVYEKSTTRAHIRRSWARGIKTCGLHSSWWHLCYREATKRNVFYILDSLENGVGEGIQGQTMLSVHNNVLFGIKYVYESILEKCSSSARSLLCFGPYHQYQVPVCFGLRSLERLDILNVRFYEFPHEVTELVELRYLALTCNGEIPPSISKLSELRFLIVHRHFRIIKRHGAVSYLPVEIWDLKELRYLEIMGCDIDAATVLPNLSKLLKVSKNSCKKSVFEGLPKLRKLGIRIELTPFGDDDHQPTSCFDHVSLLKGLQSFKCVVVNPDFTSNVSLPPVLPAFPSKLTKLTLSGMGCSWEEMSKIALLKHLQVLKLRSNAFRGLKWEIKGYGFVKLEYLLIEDCDFVGLEMGVESFKDLKYLCMKHCYKLKDLWWEPGLSIANIEVIDCNPLAVKHMKKAMLRSEESVDSFSVHSSWTVKS